MTGRHTGLDIDNNNGITHCCVTTAFSGSGNGLGGSGCTNCGGGVSLDACRLESGMGVGLAGAARTVIQLTNAFSSCAKPLSKKSAVCGGVVISGPMLFPTCCPASSLPSTGRILCNGTLCGGGIRCAGPCTRLAGKCGSCSGSAVSTRFRLGRSLSFVAGKLGMHNLFGASHCTCFRMNHTSDPCFCGMDSCSGKNSCSVVRLGRGSGPARCLRSANS